MPVQSGIRLVSPLSGVAGGEISQPHSFARPRRGARAADWAAYKGRPAAKPASPPAEKAPAPKEAQPPAEPKPSEPAREGGSK
jgi:hypothetical protein